MSAYSVDFNLISIRPAVEFINIQDQYNYNEDLNCQFIYNNYEPQEGDRIAIFRVGWNYVKDYIVFEWAPIGSKNGLNSVIFNRHILPRNHLEIYQICYVSADNELHGATSPFQFSANKVKGQNSNIVRTPKMQDISKPNNSTLATKEINEEMKKLENENIMLWGALRFLTSEETNAEESKTQCYKEIEAMKENIHIISLTLAHATLDLNKYVPEDRNYQKHVEDLHFNLSNLQDLFNSQQKEIEKLRSKIIECGGEYKKLYLEKVKLKKKLEKMKAKSEIKQDPNSFDLEDLKTLPPFPLPQDIQSIT